MWLWACVRYDAFSLKWCMLFNLTVLEDKIRLYMHNVNIMPAFGKTRSKVISGHGSHPHFSEYSAASKGTVFTRAQFWVFSLPASIWVSMCVCLCKCVCFNHKFVHTITFNLFKLDHQIWVLTCIKGVRGGGHSPLFVRSTHLHCIYYLVPYTDPGSWGYFGVNSLRPSDTYWRQWTNQHWFR